MTYPELRKFKMAVDANLSSSTLIPVLPAAKDVLALAANTAKAYTLPTGAKVIILTANDDFWVDPSGTAAIPAVDNIAGNAPMFKPNGILLPTASQEAITTLSFIAPRACLVSIWIYK